MLTNRTNQDFSHQAGINKEPASEGSLVSHLPFSKLFSGCGDLRTIIDELRNFPRIIDPSQVVIDSDMKLHEAFRGLSPDCPDEIVAQQQLLRVFYLGSDGNLHHGQVLIHEALVSDVLGAFKVMLNERIPIESVIPVSHPDFERDGKWDDMASMLANNSSGFNHRRVLTATGEQKRLSLHGLGMAFDVNPVQNPCYGDPVLHSEGGYHKEAAAGYKAMIPPNGTYDLSDSRSFHGRHPLVLFLQERGWTWGGDWAEPKDLHHFQKIPAGLEARVAELRAPAV